MRERLETTRFVIPLLKGNMLIMVAEDIKYIKSDGPIVYITDREDQQIVGGHSLKFYSQLLGDNGFIQISQSILVNKRQVRYIDAVNQEVELFCGKRLNMSRNGCQTLKEQIRKSLHRW